MRIPGTRSSTASTILQQQSLEDERKVARSRSKQARNQQLQAGIIGGANLAGDIVRVIPQFQANSIRESEGAKERAFEQAMELARQGFTSGEAGKTRNFTAGEGALNRQSQEKIAQTRSDPVSEALSLLIAERADKDVQDIRTNPRFPAADRDAAEAALLRGKTTPAIDQFRAKERQAAPIRQAAAYSGIKDADPVGSLDPGAYAGMGRDEFLALIGNLAVEGGEQNPAIPQALKAAGGKIPPFPKFPTIGEILNPFNTERDQARSEIQRLIEAIQMQESGPGMTAATGGTPIYSAPPQPLSPATRKYILELRKSMAAE